MQGGRGGSCFWRPASLNPQRVRKGEEELVPLFIFVLRLDGRSARACYRTAFVLCEWLVFHAQERERQRLPQSSSMKSAVGRWYLFRLPPPFLFADVRTREWVDERKRGITVVAVVRGNFPTC